LAFNTSPKTNPIRYMTIKKNRR